MDRMYGELVGRIARVSAIAGLILPVFAAVGGTAPEDHFLMRASAAVDAGELELALAVAEEGLEAGSGAPHGWLLVGRVRGELGDYAGAVQAFRRAEIEVPLLGDCAVLARSDLALRSGYVEDAEAGYREGLEKYPASPQVSRMRLGLGRAAGLAGHPERARDALRAFLSSGPGEEEAVEALWLLGQALVDLEDWAAARDVYERLWKDYPAAPEADAAGDALETLHETRGLGRSPLSAEQMFERARRLERGGRFPEAVDQLEEIVRACPEHSIIPDVLHEQGSVCFRQARNREALETLKSLLKSYPESDPAPDALYLVARIHWREGSRHRFLSTCEEIREVYPGTRAAENAEFAVAVFYGEEKKWDKAREALRAIISGPPEHSRRRDALWQLGRLDYREGDLDDARASFADLASDESSGYWKAALYWEGRCLRNMGRTDDARAVLSVLAGRCPGHYYGIEARRRLGEMGVAPDTSAGRPTAEPVDFRLPPGWGGEAYVRVRLLDEVGFYGPAEEEMRALVKNGPPGARLAFARTAQRAGDYGGATDDIENHFGRLIESLPEGPPREFWEVAFPYAYRSEIERLAAEFGLDPLLAAAVIREESRFDANAVSRAGAVGLLQLMPGTAKEEGRRLGMRTRNLNLFDPATNLRLGMYSLSRRIERFGGDRVRALAAYNAGDRKVRRWNDLLKGLEQDEFIDQMPYLETRLYVKRILASYEQYRRLYGAGEVSRAGAGIGLTPAEGRP